MFAALVGAGDFSSAELAEKRVVRTKTAVRVSILINHAPRFVDCQYAANLSDLCAPVNPENLVNLV
jgi:hypothetical protein